jgi:F-type H+-transporting ATPase subunit b
VVLALMLTGAASAEPIKADGKLEKDAHPKAEAKPDHAGEGGQGHGEAKKDENPLSIAVDLGIWTVVVFVLLMLFLRWKAWKPMLEGLKKREENISSALVEAAKARAEAQRLQGYLDEQKAKMGEEVRKAIEEARRDALRLRDEMVAHARTEIQAERDRLQRELSISKDQALKEIWNQAADLATLISARAIRRNLTADDHRRLVDEALTDFRKTGSQRVQEVTKMM